MGNWKTVRIVGTCGADDVEALKQALVWNSNNGYMHCLSYTPSLFGLPLWAQTKFDVQGNLAYSSCSVDDVAEQLRALVTIVPSLNLIVHCGGQYESTKVVASIVVKNGAVNVEPAHMPLLCPSTDTETYGW